MVLINFLLILIATAFLLLLGGVSFIIAIIHLSFSVSKGRDKKVGKYFRKIALTIDVLGAVMCGSLFNLILLKQNSQHKFKGELMTVSKILGYNEAEGTLTKLGEKIVSLLNKIEKDHCKNAIN